MGEATTVENPHLFEVLTRYNGMELSVLNWYKENMTSSEKRNLYLPSLLKTNQQLDSLTYIAMVHLTGLAKPTVIKSAGAEGFSSGYATATIYVYDIASGTEKQHFEVFATNSESIQTFNDNSNIEKSLEIDLQRKLYREVVYALRIEKKTKVLE
jgi:hypothetical protein